MKLNYLLFTLLPFTAAAQSFKVDSATKSPTSNQPYIMIDSVVQTVYKKSQLYSNALSYISTSFGDSRAVIEVKDQELGEIIFSGNVRKAMTHSITDKKGKITYINTNAKLFFKCKIYFKDDKFRVILTSLEYPFSDVFNTGVNISLKLANVNEPENSRAARELAYSLIKDISTKINSKPENDF